MGHIWIPLGLRENSDGIEVLERVTGQYLGLVYPADHILLHGTRGSAKSDTQLMRFRRYVGLGYGAFWRGIILDAHYGDLDDLVEKSLKWFYRFGDGARFLSSHAEYKWHWPTGEELLFRQMAKLSDYQKHHGKEFPYIGWNELTKQASPDLYDTMMSCNRSSFLPPENSRLPRIPLTVFSTTNSWGVGYSWVKHRFIDASPSGHPLRVTTNVFNPQTQRREDVTVSQIAIYCSYKENKYLDPKYIAQLENIKDPNRRKSWLLGSWDITSGGAIDDLWNSDVHVKKRFRCPWPVYRALDWGSTEPFSVGWWAIANGEEARLDDGSVFCPPSETMIRVDEWYGAESLELNVGIKLSSKKIAEGILRREKILLSAGWISRPVLPGPADNQICNVTDTSTDTIEKIMERAGVSWENSDKSSGSRRIGLELIRTRLEASFTGEGPGLYVMDNCAAFRATVPPVRRSEKPPHDDVDSSCIDHVYDETRYMALSLGSMDAASIDFVFPR